MRKCTKCGGDISDIAIFCEHCGVRLDPTKIIDSEQGLPELEPIKTKTENQVDEKDIEELDLTELDKKTVSESAQKSSKKHAMSSKRSSDSSIIDLKDILEKDEKVTMDDSIKREALADDEIFTKICPMCGEEMEINKKLLANGPLSVKCLKCGNETRVW